MSNENHGLHAGGKVLSENCGQTESAFMLYQTLKFFPWIKTTQVK